MPDLLFLQEGVNVAIPTRCMWVFARARGLVNGGPHGKVVARCLVPAISHSSEPPCSEPLWMCLSQQPPRDGPTSEIRMLSGKKHLQGAIVSRAAR